MHRKGRVYNTTSIMHGEILGPVPRCSNAACYFHQVVFNVQADISVFEHAKTSVCSCYVRFVAAYFNGERGRGGGGRLGRVARSGEARSGELQPASSRKRKNDLEGAVRFLVAALSSLSFSPTRSGTQPPAGPTMLHKLAHRR